MNLQTLFEEMHRRQFTPGAGVPAFEFAEDPGPWYTRVLLGFMGWLGGMLVLGFFVSLISGLLDSPTGMAILAAILFGASFAIYRAFPVNDFATQFALAASLCGQTLAVFAFGKLIGGHSDVPVACFAAGLEVLLVWLMPNFVHRLLSTLFAVLAIFVATKNGIAGAAVNTLLALALVYLVRAESTLVAGGQRALAEPVLAGVAIGLLVAGAGYLKLVGATPLLPYAPLAALAFGLGLVLWIWLAMRALPRMQRAAAIAAAIAFSAAAWRAPGLIAAALVLLASFALGRRMLTAFALVALVGYLSTYYYQMEFTLALKSAVLAATGGVLLICGWVHRRYFCVEVA